jgi:hypothetical protein
MLEIMFIIYNNRHISSISLYHKAQYVCPVIPFYVSMLRTHKDARSQLNRTFWNSNNKLVTFKVYKSHAATKHLEFHFCSGFIRLTLRNRERRFTSTTGNCRYGWSIDWIFTAQRTVRRRCKLFRETFIHSAQLLKTLPALLQPQNSASSIQSTLLCPFTLRYITISCTSLYLSTIPNCLFNSNFQIKYQHVCHLPSERYIFCPCHYDYVHKVDNFTMQQTLILRLK